MSLLNMGGQEIDLLNLKRMQQQMDQMNQQARQLGVNGIDTPQLGQPAPAPVQAPAPAPVQPIQQRVPPQPKRNLFQRVGDALKDPVKNARIAEAFNQMRFAPSAGITAHYNKMQELQVSQQQANQTVAYLERIGRTDLADLVRQQPSLAPEVLKAILTQQGKQETYGTSVHYYTDAEGNPQAYQTSAFGGKRDLELPEGATPVTSESAAAGKKFTALELQYLTEKEQDGKEGIDVMSRQLISLENALADPEIMDAISSKVGVLQGRVPAVTSNQTLGESYIENFAAKSFMRAFQMLKGGGQITEREGAAAAAAIDRLQKFTLSDEDYKKAMEDARDELQDLVDIAESRQLVLAKQLSPYRARMNQMLGL